MASARRPPAQRRARRTAARQGSRLRHAPARGAMSTRRVPFAMLAVLLFAGCATRFSPEMIRDEIGRQSGREPRTAFELSLGKISTRLIRKALDAEAVGGVSLVGVEELHVAVFEVPGARQPALDVTRMSVRGWELALRFVDESRSGVVLTRACGASVGDVVVVGSAANAVLYARLRGDLSPALPAALGETLRDDGPRALRDVLTALAGAE